MTNRIALIDADSLVYINVHCKKLLSNDNVEIIDDWGKAVREVKTLQQCKDSVDNMIKNILLTTEATHYLLFLTVGKNFRYDIYPEYKANRKYGDKPAHFDAIKEYLITNYKAVYDGYLEADDLCMIYLKELQGSFMCAIDKDMLKTTGTHYNYAKNQWVTVTQEEANCNFWTSMITGDTVDNIKGIPGKGIKYAEQLLQSCEYAYKDVLGAYIDKFGEELGIQEYYKNYMVLKIKDKWDGLEIVQPIEIENEFQEREN